MSDQYCTFLVDRFLCGIPVGDVQEIQRSHPVTRVPLAPPAITGLMNLRGQIVTTIDLRQRLGLGEGAAGRRTVMLVVRHGGGTASLVADRIGDVIAVDPTTREAVPPTLQGVRLDVLAGVHQLERGLLLILDTARCCSIPELLRT